MVQHLIYTVDIDPRGFVLDLPAGARALGIQVPGGKPVISFVMDPNAPVIQRWFKVVHSGQTFTSSDEGPFPSGVMRIRHDLLRSISRLPFF